MYLHSEGDFWPSPLTLIKVLVSITGLYFRAELVPQAMQLPLDGIEARHCSLEKAGFNDAYVDPEVVYISPRNRSVIYYSIIYASSSSLCLFTSILSLEWALNVICVSFILITNVKPRWNLSHGKIKIWGSITWKTICPHYWHTDLYREEKSEIDST